MFLHPEHRGRGSDFTDTREGLSMEAHDFVLFCVPRSSLAHQGETVESVFLSVSVRTGDCLEKLL